MQRKSVGKDGKEKKAKKVKREVKPRPVSGYIMFCKGARPKLAKEEGREFMRIPGLRLGRKKIADYTITGGTIVSRTYGTDKKPICFPVFTNNIWSYLLWPLVIHTVVSCP